jgi:hypothetical protein
MEFNTVNVNANDNLRPASCLTTGVRKKNSQFLIHDSLRQRRNLSVEN